ncbi:fasciclin-3 isoform X2 [Anabrus simplex]|uniref:fasciclin-3 isoform X2 n=1 Tax=Anabrus simplex TaxID=316456 RepID=UPI0035A3C363
MSYSFYLVSLFAVAVVYYGAAGAPPTVDVYPQVAVVRVGQNLSVSCRSGKVLQYCRIEHLKTRRSWNLNPHLPPSDGVVYYGDGLDKGQCGFTIPRVQTDNNGQYRCTMGFTDVSEEGTGTVNVTVAVPPSVPELSVSSVSGSVRNDGFKEGDTISASCIIRDGRPVSNLSWYMGDEQITRDMSMPVVIHIDNEDLYSIQQNLTYTLSWQDHGKKLRCVAQHLALENRDNQSVYQIDVQFGPRQEKEPVQLFGVIVGQPGELVYNVHANPKPRISWKINSEELTEGQIDTDGHFEASTAKNLGNGVWEAKLHISSVTSEDIERNYVLTAKNQFGEESYRIVLSTSDEPQVLQLSAAAIIGIVVAILVLLLAIFLLIFARATGRWCFAGGVSTRQDPKESSDTESADHGPTQRSKKPKNKLTNIFKKKSDKVGDDTEMTRELERAAVQPAVEQPVQQMPKQKDNIVYAELDLRDVKGVRRPQVRAEDEKTEYAEIVYTTKPEEEKGAQ